MEGEGPSLLPHSASLLTFAGSRVAVSGIAEGPLGMQEEEDVGASYLLFHTMTQAPFMACMPTGAV